MLRQFNLDGENPQYMVVSLSKKDKVHEVTLWGFIWLSLYIGLCDYVKFWLNDLCIPYTHKHVVYSVNLHVNHVPISLPARILR